MRNLACAFSAISIFCAAPVCAAPPDIGAAAIIKNTVTASMAAQKRVIKPGDRVHQNESIVTGKEAGAQLLFRDETTLTMGADSSVVLDTFVYDPEKRLGKISIRAVTGAFRFVSGSAPKNAYQITTPVGTIGVRGTILQFWLIQNQLTMQLDEGAAFFCNARCVVLDKPGTYVVVTGQSIGDTKSKYGPPSLGNPHVQSDPMQNQYLQFLDTKKFSPPPHPPQILPDGTRPR